MKNKLINLKNKISIIIYKIINLKIKVKLISIIFWKCLNLRYSKTIIMINNNNKINFKIAYFKNKMMKNMMKKKIKNYYY